MRYSTFTASLLAITGTVSASGCKARAVCNADNCARLVTGTQRGLATTRLADCSSYQTTTVKGPDATSTVTGTDSTSTVTVTPIVVGVTTVTTVPVYEYTTATQTALTVVRGGAGNQFSLRAVTTNASVTINTVPAYAVSSCPASRYASACSCAGVTAATSTVPGTTITNTVPGSTVTVTVTAVPVESDILTAATTTVQSTVVATAVGPVKTGYTCGSTVQGNGIYSFRRYRVNCGQRVTGGNIAFVSNYVQESECLRSCNSNRFCVYAEYAFSSGECNLYYTSPTAIVDDPDRDALILL